MNEPDELTPEQFSAIRKDLSEAAGRLNAIAHRLRWAGYERQARSVGRACEAVSVAYGDVVDAKGWE